MAGTVELRAQLMSCLLLWLLPSPFVHAKRAVQRLPAGQSGGVVMKDLPFRPRDIGNLMYASRAADWPSGGPPGVDAMSVSSNAFAPRNFGRSMATKAPVFCSVKSSMMPSPLLKTVASARNGCSPGRPVMTVMNPVPTTLPAGQAALPLCWNC